MINLDHNATTAIHPEVLRAMADCYMAGHGNAASSHRLGRRARQVVEDARDEIGQILGTNTTGIQSDRIIFTSGGTEANNLALFGMAGRAPGRVILSAVEHPSVVGPCEQLARRGFDIQHVGVDPRGVVDLNHLERLLAADTRLVSVMLANHETGVLQPIAQLAELCRRRGVPVHTDAVQAVGKTPVDFTRLQVTALTLTAHKFHGPSGIGALVAQRDARIEPQLFGGFQQQGTRPGTEPVELVVGLLHALRIWVRDATTRAARMTALRDRFEELLRQADIGIVVNGQSAPRLPHTASIAFSGLDCQAVHMALDLAGVACSSGSACASGSSAPSPVLQAMGLPDEIVRGSLRFSLGAFTTRQDIDTAAQRIILAVGKMRAGRRAIQEPRA